MAAASKTIGTARICPNGLIPHLVSGEPFGIGRLHHLRRLGPQGRRQLLHRNLAIRGNDDAGRFAVGEDHQRLEHALRRLSEGLRSLEADTVRIGVVIVRMDGKDHTGRFESAGRAGNLRHAGTVKHDETATKSRLYVSAPVFAGRPQIPGAPPRRNRT